MKTVTLVTIISSLVVSLSAYDREISDQVREYKELQRDLSIQKTSSKITVVDNRDFFDQLREYKRATQTLQYTK